MPPKTPLKRCLLKKLQKCIFCFAFVKLYIWMKGKTDLLTFNNPNGESHEKKKKNVKKREAWLKSGNFT